MIVPLGDLIDLFVHPGEIQLADRNFRLRTTLGSCIALTAWHPEKRLGGMCHIMLPDRQRTARESLNGRYASEAVALLEEQMRYERTRIHEYHIKLFGGGQMFAPLQPTSPSISVRNVRQIRAIIASYDLSVDAESLGGYGYRNVIFDIGTGDVWVKHVKQTVGQKGGRQKA